MIFDGCRSSIYRDIEVQAQFTVNQSRPEEITMREDLGNITLVGDDGFGKKNNRKKNQKEKKNRKKKRFSTDSVLFILVSF